MSRNVVIPRPDIEVIGSKRTSRSADRLNDYVTRREMIDGVSNAALAVGEKVYAQLASESATFLDQMEATLREEIRREFHRQSLRGRIEQWQLRFRHSTLGEYLVELGVLVPEPLSLEPNPVPTVPYFPADDKPVTDP